MDGVCSVFVFGWRNDHCSTVFCLVSIKMLKFKKVNEKSFSDICILKIPNDEKNMSMYPK